jgi:high-affinity iron transporter
MEALVITLREGMEITLIVGLILAYLKRTGRSILNRYVYAGLILAVGVSLAGAAGFSLMGFNPENEVLEGTLLAIAAVLVATLIIWMWRTSRRSKQYIETQLETLTGQAGRRQGWGLLGLTFFMILREGIEIVLFLAALSLTATGGLLQLIGGVTGLGLAVLFGFLFIKGSIRIDLRRFFGITGLVLMVLVVRLLAGSVHAFSEAGLLPSTAIESSVIGFIVRDSTSLVILVGLVLLPVLAMLPGMRSRREKDVSVAQ